MPEDFSNGYEAVAEEFIAIRSNYGREIVRKWAKALPQGASVIDIGAGSGEPLTSALIKAGLNVSAIDASPKMVAAFKQNFPDINVVCEPAEQSSFFNQNFDAALAIGLIFLLPEQGQIDVIRKIGSALNLGGKLLFTAPKPFCQWDDLLTGKRSLSLGADKYRKILVEASLKPINKYTDKGGAIYYEAEKLRTLPVRKRT